MAPRLQTRLTEALGIEHPILSAPMARVSGGALAGAVTKAGGLGLIGGGYGEADFLADAFRDAGNSPVGCGFITWSLAGNPTLLDQALAHEPVAMMLSFGDPTPFARRIKDVGCRLICQCQSMADVAAALACGADIVVAQGGEAGGHGAWRGTMTIVAEAADLLAARAPETLLLAAGGIADGRGLAAALMLGADGVLMGTRFWAATESLAPTGHKQAVLPADGDATLKTTSLDTVRRKAWPEPFQIRVKRNAFTDRWHGRDDALATVLETESERFAAAYLAGDADNSTPVCGEAIGMIDRIEPAAQIIENVVSEAARRLAGGARAVG